jgi:hypothetical protein
VNATAIAPADRFSAARIDGRWKVLDALTGTATTCASRTKAEERVAKLIAAADAELDAAYAAKVAEEDETRRQEAIAAQAAEDAKVAEAIAAAPLAVVTLDGEETTVEVTETPELTPAELAAKVTAEAEAEGRYADAREARSAELAERVNAGEMTFDEAAALLITERGEVPAKPAAEPMRSLWVAAAFVPIILADAAPERATLVAKLDASVPNNRGGRTVRLTRAEAEELAAIGTEIENSVNGAGRMAHSARTMRDRLAALWA